MGFLSAVTIKGMRASRQPSPTDSPTPVRQRRQTGPRFGRPVRTTSRQLTTTVAAAITPAPACSAAPAKPPDTACAANALPAATRSATPAGPSSKQCK